MTLFPYTTLFRSVSRIARGRSLLYGIRRRMQVRFIERAADRSLTLKSPLTRQTPVHARHPGYAAAYSTAKAAAQAAGIRWRDDCQRGDADRSQNVFNVHRRSPLTAAHRAAFTH
jgi:hypothetical protein